MAKQNTSARGWLRGVRLSWFSVVMMGLLVIGVIVIAPTLRLFVEQNQHIADLKKSNARLSSEVDTLNQQIARWNDPSYIQAQARDRLLYVMPGQTSYLIIDDRAPSAKKKSQPVSTHVVATHTDWLTALVGSVLTAGTTTAPASALTTANTSAPGTK